ncbi:MAG: ArsR/SmtB family transcription factor [Mycoplasma sp.]
MTNKELSHCFKILSDETRVTILQKLNQKTQCGCDMLESFNITQPTFSYHMKLLVEANLVIYKKNGVCNNYSINKEKITELSDFFDFLAEGNLCKQ